jgi:hypothetical protein
MRQRLERDDRTIWTDKVQKHGRVAPLMSAHIDDCRSGSYGLPVIAFQYILVVRNNSELVMKLRHQHCMTFKTRNVPARA